MKKILIYGMGKTGKELARFCTKRKIPFSTFDDNSNKPEEFQKYIPEGGDESLQRNLNDNDEFFEA